MSRRLLGVVFATVAMLTLPQMASAQLSPYSWAGGGGDANWSNAANWTDADFEAFAPVSSASDRIVFSGTTRTTSFNDNVGFQINRITITNDGTYNRIINGNDITFSGTSPQLVVNSGSAAARSPIINAKLSVTASNLSINLASALQGQGNAPELILNGGFTGTGNVSRIDGGTGLELVLNNSNNTSFSGTYSNAGITALTGVNALGRRANIELGASNTNVFQIGNTLANLVAPVGSPALPLLGVSQQLGDLNGGGTIEIGNNATVLTGFLNGATAVTTSSGIFSDGTNTHIGKVGTGTWNWSGANGGASAASTFLGTTSVRDGTILIDGLGTFGTTNAAPTTALTASVYAGATLTVAANLTTLNRIQNNTNIVLNGGNLTYSANVATAQNEVAGVLTLAAGQSNIRITNSAARTQALSFAGLTQPNGTASVFFRAPNLGVNATGDASVGGNISVNGAAGPTAGLFSTGGTAGYTAANTSLRILPFATSGSLSTPETFVAYDTTNQSLRGLNTATDYATAFGASNLNVNLAGGSATEASGQAANAVRISGAGGINITGGTFTVGSGALLSTVASSITNGTIAFSNTAFITNNAALGITSAITAPNLSKNGAGVLTVGNIDLSSATQARTIAVNAGTLNIGGTVNAGGLSPVNTLTYQVSRGAVLTTSSLNIGANQILQGGGTNTVTTGAQNPNAAIVSGDVTVATGGTIRASSLSGNNLAIASPGALSINGGLTLQGGGTYEWYANSVHGAVTPGVDGSAATTGVYTQSIIRAGTLDLSGVSSGNKFNIKVTTLKLDNTFGQIYDYDGTALSFTIGQFTGITGFAADKFNVQYSAEDFANGTGLVFTVSQVGNSLVLNAAVPEPMTTLAIAAGGLGLIGLIRRRNRSTTTPAIAA